MSAWYSSTRRLTFCLATASIAGGCAVTAPPPEPVALDVQSGNLSAATSFAVRNVGSQVVFVSSCGGHVLPEIERRSGGQWVNAAAAICPAIFSMAPIRVEAGDVLRESVTIPVVGTYRLRVSVLTGSPSAAPESVVSPSFTIE